MQQVSTRPSNNTECQKVAARQHVQNQLFSYESEKCYFLTQEPALKQSTEQLLNKRSNELKNQTARDDYKKEGVCNTGFMNYDYNNMYRTAYKEMSYRGV